MNNYMDKMNQTVDYIKEKVNEIPKLAIILGSGLGSLADDITEKIVKGDFDIDYEKLKEISQNSIKKNRSHIMSYFYLAMIAIEEKMYNDAFDYANNLYATSSSTKTLSRYAIPSWHEGAVVTPGNAIGTGGDGDANSDGVVDIADVTYVLTLMARNGYEAKADVNGDGTVDIADVTNILTIMASQEQ